MRTLPLCVATALLFSACAKRKHVPVPAGPVVGAEERGVASWYGHPYHGRPSSSGEIYDMEQLTAAHRTLPFGTVVRVRNLGNEKTVTLRINDRGPFVDGRIIDVSHAAARALGMIGPGTAPVLLKIVSLPLQVPGGYFAVQTGAFRERANAERQRKAMEKAYGSAEVQVREGKPRMWRVLVGHEATEQAAEAIAGRVRAGQGTAFVVRVDTPGGDLSSGGRQF